MHNVSAIYSLAFKCLAEGIIKEGSLEEGKQFYFFKNVISIKDDAKREGG